MNYKILTMYRFNMNIQNIHINENQWGNQE
jgi:hypothetical protein